MRVDYIISQEGRALTGLLGGNALYAAVGATIWSEHVGLWGRLGDNYSQDWLQQLKKYGLATAGLKRIPGDHDHRTFYAYLPNGQRDDTDPTTHYARIQHPLPVDLVGCIHSTPDQDNPMSYEPLAIRPGDWPVDYDGVTAVHLSPLPIRSHLDIPPFLRQRGIRQITVDPGERYMKPSLIPYLRRLLPEVSAFMPSEQEISSLYGSGLDLYQAARLLAQWGAPLVIIKRGAKGVLIYEADQDRQTELTPYHEMGTDRIRDVTGAGDAFCGGFMVGLAQEGNPLSAARMGLVSASLVIEGYGASYALSLPKSTAQRRLVKLTASS